MRLKIQTGNACYCLLLLIFIMGISPIQAQKKEPVHMISGGNIWLGIDSTVEREIVTALTKWYGKAKANEILDYANANNWPKKVIGAMTSYDTTLYGEFFKQFRAWRIAFPGKPYSLIEMRPQENTFLNDTSFKHVFYLYVDLPYGILAGHIKNEPKKLPTEITGDDSENRKNIMAGLKKKFLTPGRKIDQEFPEFPMKGDEEFTLKTQNSKGYKHTALVITNGEDNELRLAYDDPELEETSYLNPSSSENFNGYTVTRFSYYTPGVDARVSMKTDKDATYSILLLSEKDESGYAAYMKKTTTDRATAKATADRARQEARGKNASRWAGELDEQRQHINKIRDAFDYFIKRTQWSYDFTSSHAEDEKWTWNQYLKYYNQMQDDYKYAVNIFNNNLTGMSSDNPDKPRVAAWLRNASTQIDNMQNKMKTFGELVENSKSPSYYSFRMMYDEMLGYAKKILNAEL